ncbi:hypothetical protein ACP3TM_08720 [Staphylococcus sp. IPLA37010]|uniref:Uncharacterized protein n=1 Tax=Staphylococcus equorum TaxID=246432 RepID=A0AAW7AJS3_9STAP|nr:hypothetical protein [Staphylococcus equorum]MDK9867053.1 hypothetical protein [Staphylococcus equorum]
MIRTVKDYENLSEQYNKMLEERNSLIDDLSWYKAKVSRLERQNRFLLSRKDNLFDSWRDENKRSVALSKKLEQLERENEEFKESHIKHITNMENYYKDRVQEHKEKNGELQEVIEGKNSDLLFTEDENKQLKESRDWDYEYIIKVNEENKVLERELKKKNMDADRLGYRWRNSHNEAKTYKTLLSEFSQHIGNKPSSSTYKYFRGKLDGIGIKEGE